jgi:hypothetical protein
MLKGSLGLKHAPYLVAVCDLFLKLNTSFQPFRKNVKFQIGTTCFMLRLAYNRPAFSIPHSSISS